LCDLGDVVVDEETQVWDEESGLVLRAELVPGMVEVLRQLKARGYRLGAVSDGQVEGARRILRQHGLEQGLFDTIVISEAVGVQKPDRRIFQAALDALGVAPADYGRVLMVGNNLARDVQGANNAGLVSVWLHWNDRYPTQPNDTLETPAYTATSPAELLALVEQLELVFAGASLPAVAQDSADLDLAARYAPIILLDEAEPFPPVAVGYTIFRQPAASPSFPRRLERAVGDVPPWATAIEYAVWSDWDIGHLYELEHVWTYVGADGNVVWVEASWHGWQNAMTLADGSLPLENTHPLLYAQPGKHAFAPTPAWYEEIKDKAVEECGPTAGKDGLLVASLFAGQLPKSPEAAALAARYLRARAFTPTFRFNRRFAISADILLPWPALAAWIPQRIAWWLEQLRNMNPFGAEPLRAKSE
jgi:HAD superfamily hydrolase (TIGR01549 family)